MSKKYAASDFNTLVDQTLSHVMPYLSDSADFLYDFLNINHAHMWQGFKSLDKGEEQVAKKILENYVAALRWTPLQLVSYQIRDQKLHEKIDHFVAAAKRHLSDGGELTLPGPLEGFVGLMVHQALFAQDRPGDNDRLLRLVKFVSSLGDISDEMKADLREITGKIDGPTVIQVKVTRTEERPKVVTKPAP